ncbi:hypothetical protein FM102_07635 [Corynebacterium glutamicum]|nr:hypothetical protein FM102_07635 [Corynebacterium glutamicum]
MDHRIGVKRSGQTEQNLAFVIVQNLRNGVRDTTRAAAAPSTTSSATRTIAYNASISRRIFGDNSFDDRVKLEE